MPLPLPMRFSLPLPAASLRLQVNGLDAGIVLRCAFTWGHRARGLLGCAPLDAATALWLRPCAAVHSIGMRHPLDLVFLDAQGQVLRTVTPLRPCRWAASPGAHSVLEFQAGVVAWQGFRVGDWMRAV